MPNFGGSWAYLLDHILRIDKGANAGSTSLEVSFEISQIISDTLKHRPDCVILRFSYFVFKSLRGPNSTLCNVLSMQ